MKFTELTEDQITHIKKIYSNKALPWDVRMVELSTFIGKSKRTVQKWLVKLGIKFRYEVYESPQLRKAKKRTLDPKKKRFIITWAQNDTPVHEPFFSNLEAYAKFIKAEILVIAGRYKNPTSVFSDKSHETWEKIIDPYLDANRHDIHKYLSILSDVRVQPTAVDPMTGLQGMTGINSCIIGSPKMQLEMLPVLEGTRPKMMITTGACTFHNYTDSKSGKKGEFHHILGFVVVEIKDEEVFFVRQVTATEEGNFTDLFYKVSYDNDEVENRVTEIEHIEAAVLGDLHWGKHDEKVMKSTLDLFSKLYPKNVILHDVFDGNSINHHENGDPFIQYHKEVSGENSLKKEIDTMLNGIKIFEPYNTVIVRSNHDDFIDRWLKSTDWRKTVTPKNSLEYMEFSAAILLKKAPNGIIPFLINQRYPKFKTLGRSDSFIVKDWELGQHGDIGSNGSRGSLLQFRKLNTKVIVGHYHSPGRKDGALSVGTSTKLRIGYNIGASNWHQSHVIIHEDSKAQHIHFVDGEYTTLKKSLKNGKARTREPQKLQKLSKGTRTAKKRNTAASRRRK